MGEPRRSGEACPLSEAIVEAICAGRAEAERRFRRRTATRLALFAGWKRERILAALDERTADLLTLQRAEERVRGLQKPWKLGSYGTD